MCDGMGAIILKRNFYIKKRESRSRKIYVQSRSNDRSNVIVRCHVDVIGNAMRRSEAYS